MNTEEQSYLDLLKHILEKGSVRKDRTGIGTIGIFGSQLRFSLENDVVPMLTTKKMFTKGIIEELLFFIRGETDTKKLEAKGVNIWKGNTSREFLDKKGLSNYAEGEMGPMYGYKWRNFNGVDQLSNALELIKNNPESRRIVVTAYDPSASALSVLDPCHMFFQFYVDNGKLSCQWYQRSCDYMLGIPFNILSYAVLTCIMAKASGLKPGELIFSGGDIHIYQNHLIGVKEQLKREPYPFPTMKINKMISTVEDMEKLELSDFEFSGYQSHPSIKVAMAV